MNGTYTCGMNKEIKLVKDRQKKNQLYETRKYYSSLFFSESISLVRTESSDYGQQHKITMIVDYYLNLTVRCFFCLYFKKQKAQISKIITIIPVRGSDVPLSVILEPQIVSA